MKALPFAISTTIIYWKPTRWQSCLLQVHNLTTAKCVLLSDSLGRYVLYNTMLLALSSCRKNQLSLSHLVLEIIGPKFDLIFHSNLWFDNFKALFIFVLDFDLVDFIIIFFYPHFYIFTTVDLIQSIFHCVLDHSTDNLVTWPPDHIYGYIFLPTSLWMF